MKNTLSITIDIEDWYHIPSSVIVAFISIMDAWTSIRVSPKSEQYRQKTL